MLNNRQGLRPVNTIIHEFVVDTNKGVYLDSRAMNQQQFTRYFRTQCNAMRPDLNTRQSGEFFRKYVLGERLLQTKKFENNYNIMRLTRMAGSAFIHNHLTQIFGPSYAISNLFQPSNIGYNRTDEQRQKIAQYGQNRHQNARKLGLISSPAIKKPSVQQIAEALRQKYNLSGKKHKSAAPADQ